MSTAPMSTPQATPRRHRRGWRAFAMRLLMLVVLMALADLLVRAFLCLGGRFFLKPLPPYGLLFTEEQARKVGRELSTYGRFDATLGWSIRPNGVSEDGLYRANSAGFRAEREYAAQTPEGVLRVAAFGDSYTHGSTVDNSATWTQLLEQTDPQLEVLNFGVGGYGTDQAYLRYQRDGVPYRPQIVLIGFMVENILRNVSVYRPAYYHKTNGVGVKPRFRVTSGEVLEHVPNPARNVRELGELIKSRRLLDTLRETDYWVARAPLAYETSPLFWSSLFSIGYAAYENSGRRPEYYYRDVSSEPFKVSARLLVEFSEHALRDGAQQAVVLLFPDRRTVVGDIDDGAEYWRTMTVVLDERGVAYIDFVPIFREAAARDGVASLFNDNHYNGKGNALVADTLARTLAAAREERR